jgi:hypothetical protein
MQNEIPTAYNIGMQLGSHFAFYELIFKICVLNYGLMMTKKMSKHFAHVNSTASINKLGLTVLIFLSCL